MAARRAGAGGQGAFVGNLDGRARAQGAQAGAGRRAVGRPSRDGQGGELAGQPAQPLRREAELADPSRTHAPRPLRVARAVVEGARVVAVWVHVSLVLVVAAALVALLDRGPGRAVASAGRSSWPPVPWP